MTYTISKGLNSMPLKVSFQANKIAWCDENIKGYQDKILLNFSR